MNNDALSSCSNTFRDQEAKDRASRSEYSIFQQAELRTQCRPIISDARQTQQGGVYLEDWIIPQAVLGFAPVVQLVLTWKLVIGNILASNDPPAPLLLWQPAYE